MKSKFTFGMFAGFALASLFFFFFLYFFPSVFRAEAAKESPAYDKIGYYGGYDPSPVPEYDGTYVASAEYSRGTPMVSYPPSADKYSNNQTTASPNVPEAPTYEATAPPEYPSAS